MTTIEYINKSIEHVQAMILICQKESYQGAFEQYTKQLSQLISERAQLYTEQFGK